MKTQMGNGFWILEQFFFLFPKNKILNINFEFWNKFFLKKNSQKQKSQLWIWNFGTIVFFPSKKLANMDLNLEQILDF